MDNKKILKIICYIKYNLSSKTKQRGENTMSLYKQWTDMVVEFVKTKGEAAFWNEYTNFTIYITDSSIQNFQVKLRSLILDDQSLAAASSAGVFQTTIQNAAIITAILPPLIIYPICQKYFVTGINMGAVKE